MYHTFIPEIFVQLSIEANHHPRLLQILENVDPDFVIRFASIAAYVGVIMDDEYTQEDFERIGQILLTRLHNKRVEEKKLIVPEDFSRYLPASKNKH